MLTPRGRWRVVFSNASFTRSETPVNHWVILTRECESSEPESVACGRNPHGCVRYPDEPDYRTENGHTKPDPAKPLQDSGLFALALNRLGARHPLTIGLLEFRFWEFGSPSATLFITENREFGENSPMTACFRQGCDSQNTAWPRRCVALGRWRRSDLTVARRHFNVKTALCVLRQREK
jgi:hypothetical protein